MRKRYSMDTLLDNPTLLQKSIDRFWTYVEKTDNCWTWKAARKKAKLSYGVFRGWAAHRFAYFITYGRLPPEIQVCHKCDNPSCVRPDHLFPGTALDNIRDCHLKGRRKAANLAPGRDARSYESRIFSQTLRRLREQHKMTQKALGDILGLDPTCVSLWEKGNHLPSLATIFSLVKIFRCDFNTLLSGTEEAPCPNN